MVARANGEPFSRRMFKDLLNDERKVFSLADLVVFPSPGAAAEYTAAFPEQLSRTRIAYIRSAVAPPSTTSQAHPTPGTAPVLFVGRYVGHKGFDLFCEAAEIAQAQDPDLHFQSLGAGPMKAFGPVADLGWSEQPHERMLGAAMVVIANRVAYYDLLPLECAALGLPLVMTPVGGNVDQQRLLPDSVLAGSATSRHLAEAILTAAEHKLTRPTWGSRNREAYAAYFTVPQMARDWDAALAESVT